MDALRQTPYDRRRQQGIATPATHGRTNGRWQAGDLLGRFLLTDRIGEGSYGEVFKAQHLALAMPVAVKILKPEARGRRSLQMLFSREARLLARLNDPSIVRVFDFHNEGEDSYLVMEYIEGCTLAEAVLLAGSLHWVRAGQVIDQLAGALTTMSYANVVHRDLSAGNVLLTGAGRAKLVDFGMAAPCLPRPTGEHKLTGTPAYTAPELFCGQAADWASDRYSLGVLLYQMLAGQLPWEADSRARTAAEHDRDLDRLALNLLATGSPPELVAITLRLLAYNPQERFADYAELRAGLADTFAEYGQPLVTTPATPAAAG